MKQIHVHIKEKDKGNRNLSLLNLREEIVGFLYKDTIALSTKADMQFYVLIFFAAVKVGKKSFLEAILDEGLPKFNELNKTFSSHKGYLRAREYRQLVNDHGLDELFENDIFFVLLEAIINIDDISPRFSLLLNEDAELKRVVKKLREKYAPELRKSLKEFASSRIRDDRYDDFGNHYDLSKSVYRTVQMRNSRNLELNLQKYTSIREITSQSPLDLNFIQSVDPQIIFDLWTKYHVTEYMKSIWRLANDSPVISGTIGGLIVKYADWKKINGALRRKDKRKAKAEFDQAQVNNGEQLEGLTLRLVESVLNANERLIEEIDIARKERSRLLEKDPAVRDKAKIKKLEDRILRLENLSVNTKLVDESKDINNS